MNQTTNTAFFDEAIRMVTELARTAHVICEQAENGRPILDRARGLEGAIYQLRREIERVRPSYEHDYVGGTSGDVPTMRETAPVRINPILMGTPQEDMGMWDGDESEDTVPTNEDVDTDDEMREFLLEREEQRLHESITNRLSTFVGGAEMIALLDTSQQMADSGQGISKQVAVQDKVPKNYQEGQDKTEKEETNEVPRNRLNSVD